MVIINKMFATFDRTYFPIVKVTFNGSPQSDDDFEQFLNQWLQLYEEKEEFMFYFDTINVSNPEIKYGLKMSQFIKKLKKQELQYLQKSFIIINNDMVKWILEFIFLIQPPVATVYIYHVSNGLLNNFNDNVDMICGHTETILIEP